ncbi:MAG TPA: RNA polymerase sigma-70 factor [Draconibacterium sp.]|nr:RNA polymerase sigma-70 factor [Draconibacterium sp.]
MNRSKASYKKIDLDEFVVKKFAMGNIEAFDYLYSIYCSRLQYFVYGLIKIKSDTEEIVQDVFVKLWINRASLKNHESFESYLFSIAYNSTLGYLRKKATEKKYIDYIKSIQKVTLDSLVENKLDLKIFNQKLKEAINSMPPRQREVFKLKHKENFTYKEIAQKLNISVNTVENHMVKSHRFLKKELSSYYLSGLLFISLFL